MTTPILYLLLTALLISALAFIWPVVRVREQRWQVVLLVVITILVLLSAPVILRWMQHPSP